MVCSMATSMVLPSMVPKRGNPNWGRPILQIPAAATEFEKSFAKVGTHQGTCTDSTDLRKWRECNRDRYDIPEWLLDAWDIEVDSLFRPERRGTSHFSNRPIAKVLAQRMDRVLQKILDFHPSSELICGDFPF
jgi:hypothetical protein